MYFVSDKIRVIRREKQEVRIKCTSGYKAALNTVMNTNTSQEPNRLSEPREGSRYTGNDLNRLYSLHSALDVQRGRRSRLTLRCGPRAAVKRRQEAERWTP